MATPPTVGLAAEPGEPAPGERRAAELRTAALRTAALRMAGAADRVAGTAAPGGLRGRRRRAWPPGSCGRRPGVGAPFSSSRTISPAALSSRRPLNTGCRSWPSPVHSLKATSATREGEVQCTPRAWTPFGGSANGGVCRSSVRRRFASRARVASPKPLPTRPAKRKAPSSSWTPSRRAPNPWRVPAGSVKPPTTNSWRRPHLLFSHERVRRPGVGAVGALGHQALEALQAGLLEDGVAAPLDVVAVAHHAVQVAAAAREQPLQA